MGLVGLLKNIESFYTFNPFHNRYPAGATNGQGGSQYSSPPEVVTTGFDQKSLPWGDDKPGGGNSNEPYIKTSLPEDEGGNNLIVDNSEANLSKIRNFISKGGVTLTNGIVKFQSTVDQAAFGELLTKGTRSVIDTVRMTKWFLDGSQGLLFTGKQNLLERQNLSQPYLTFEQKTYVPTNTILQASSNAFGVHLNRTGLLGGVSIGTSYGLSNKGYEAYALSRIGESRVQLLADSKISKITSIANLQAFQGLGKGTFVNPWFLSNDSGYSIETIMGPDSVLGVGKTRLKLLGRGDQRTDTTTYNTNNPSLSSINRTNNVYVFDNNFLRKRKKFTTNKSTTFSNILPDDAFPEGITDFRRYLPAGSSVTSSYFDFNRERSYNASSTNYQGNWKNGRILDPNEWVSQDTTLVRVDNKGGIEEILDIIPFKIEILNNNGGENQIIVFRAYLENMSDQYKASYDSYKYNGRAEDFYKYKGFGRDISLDFNVPALSRKDMIPNYQKLNALAGILAPSYSPGIGYMRGNIIRLTVGDYLKSVPGILRGINLTPVFEAGWEIDRDGNGKSLTDGAFATKDQASNKFIEPESYAGLSVGRLPKVIKVTGFDFTPIHDFVPRTQQPFIADKNYVSSNQIIGTVTSTVLPTEEELAAIYAEEQAKAQFAAENADALSQIAAFSNPATATISSNAVTTTPTPFQGTEITF
jgi:hypothetical protein